MKSVVVGTTNAAKVATIRQLLRGMAIVHAPPQGLAPNIDEIGDSVAEIALRKARSWARCLALHGIDRPVIVTDGGLTVPALGARWNPLRTHRFVGADATAGERAVALLDLARELGEDDRRIGWIEAAAVVMPSGEERLVVAESPPGRLAESLPPGAYADEPGFWVPALWLCPEFEMCRLSDLTEDQIARRTDHWDILAAELRALLSERRSSVT